jgi:hypothetical protein
MEGGRKSRRRRRHSDVALTAGPFRNSSSSQRPDGPTHRHIECSPMQSRTPPWVGRDDGPDPIPSVPPSWCVPAIVMLHALLPLFATTQPWARGHDHKALARKCVSGGRAYFRPPCLASLEVVDVAEGGCRGCPLMLTATILSASAPECVDMRTDYGDSVRVLSRAAHRGLWDVACLDGCTRQIVEISHALSRPCRAQRRLWLHDAALTPAKTNSMQMPGWPLTARHMFRCCCCYCCCRASRPMHARTHALGGHVGYMHQHGGGASVAAEAMRNAHVELRRSCVDRPLGGPAGRNRRWPQSVRAGRA